MPSSAKKKKRPAKLGKFRKYLYTPEKHQMKKRRQQTQAWTKEREELMEEECVPYTRWERGAGGGGVCSVHQVGAGGWWRRSVFPTPGGSRGSRGWSRGRVDQGGEELF